jgi:hypothetical protein
MIAVQTAKLITMQINSRFEEVRASWFFLLSQALSDLVIDDSFRQGMEKNEAT